MLKIIKYFIFSVLLVLILAIAFNWSALISAPIIYSKSLAGKGYLEKAVVEIKNNNFVTAISYAGEARADFKIALDKLQNIEGNFIVKKVSSLQSQAEDVRYLLQTADTLSQSLWQGATIAKKINDITSGRTGNNFSEFTVAEKTAILKLIYESAPELNGIKANINLALMDLKNIKGEGIVSLFMDKISIARDQLGAGSDLIDKALIVSQILPTLAGYPTPVNYLLLLQNNSELRPTGGFLGTVGVMQMSVGDIVKFTTNDSYHLDMPASLEKKFKVEPPLPLKKYLGVTNWFLRDSNWSPDWPTSAKKIEWFYRTEAQYNKVPEISQVPKFNGVIAITPNLIVDLLELVGPISVRGQEYNKNNFVDLLQYEVEMNYYKEGISQWDRKKIIGEIIKELKIKLLNLPTSRYLDLIGILNKNVKSKDVLVYLMDDGARNLVKSLGWEGEIKTPSSDYLMVVDANLAAYKTDRVMDKTVKYEITEKDDGIYAHLRINYTHNGTFDWKTTRYRNYVRVYVPLGATLIKASGMSEGKAETGMEEFFYTGATKTYFAGFISVEPGHDGFLDLEYKLPDKIKTDVNAGNYSFYGQRQPGNNIKELKVDVNFKQIKNTYSFGWKNDESFTLKP